MVRYFESKVNGEWHVLGAVALTNKILVSSLPAELVSTKITILAHSPIVSPCVLTEGLVFGKISSFGFPEVALWNLELLHAAAKANGRYGPTEANYALRLPLGEYPAAVVFVCPLVDEHLVVLINDKVCLKRPEEIALTKNSVIALLNFF